MYSHLHAAAVRGRNNVRTDGLKEIGRDIAKIDYYEHNENYNYMSLVPISYLGASQHAHINLLLRLLPARARQLVSLLLLSLHVVI